jgi:hypothetical protein
MNVDKRAFSVRTCTLLAVIGFAFGIQPSLKADVVVLKNGGVLSGTVLQQDANGVLIQTETGTYRYPQSWIQEVKKEPAAAPHVANNSRRIPDWAQIVSLLANNPWANGLQQVPATMIETGPWKNVPYVSFRCAAGGYEVNIYGDLNAPAAIQIGAMSYLSQDPGAKTNCVNFICSVLTNASDRKMVRGLSWDQPVTNQSGGMTFETLVPGEWGSYGGWWVAVRNDVALANAQASEAELLAITQARDAAAPPMAAPAPQPAATATNGAAQPEAAAAQPAVATTEPGVYTTYGATYGYAGWTREELAAARPVAPAPVAPATPYPSVTSQPTLPANAGDRVYPRSYDRSGGGYGLRRR